jgi:hypothetical protein
MTTNIVGALVQIISLVLTVDKLDWGYYGICVSTIANFIARYILTVYLVHFDSCSPLLEAEDVYFFSLETITDLCDQILLNC